MQTVLLKVTEPAQQEQPDMVKVKDSAQQNKPTIKSRIRNTLGGKNPQQLKKKGGSLGIKNISHKDKTIKSGSIVKPTVKKNVNININGTGKENEPSSSTNPDPNSMETKAGEEEAVLEYMKTIYKTRGETLLKKFRSEKSLREALAVIDDNDKNRALALRQVDQAQQQQAVNQSENNGRGPMEDKEGVISQTSTNLS